MPQCRSEPRLYLAVLVPPAGSPPEWRSGLAPPELADLLARLGRFGPPGRLGPLGRLGPARRRVASWLRRSLVAQRYSIVQAEHDDDGVRPCIGQGIFGRLRPVERLVLSVVTDQS